MSVEMLRQACGLQFIYEAPTQGPRRLLRSSLAGAGFFDSHVHSTGASMYEFDHPIPDMESIEDVLGYVRSRAASGGRRPTAGDRRSRVKMLLADYNSAGITSIVARTAGDSTVELFRGLKVFLDRGMLTGSAYMLAPWGVSRIYSIDDPNYRGMRCDHGRHPAHAPRRNRGRSPARLAPATRSWACG
jgi:hypothetical protein